jgi:uncharacterized protein (DUF983 family)
MDAALIRQAFTMTCPRCGKGSLFGSRFSLALRSVCGECGLNLAANDCGDGPAVFLIFILGFLLVPLALFFEWLVHPPLWLHAVLWGSVALGITLGALRPLKAYIIALQYKHRPGEWKP